MNEGAARSRELRRVLRDGGIHHLGQRIARVAYRRLEAATLDFPLDLDDLADSRGLDLAVPARRPTRGTPLTIGWICTPPSLGSGGHTTLFRMVEGVERAGHTCILYLYDRFRGELSRHERVIRTGWPAIRAEVRSTGSGLAPLDAYVANGFEAAHVLARRGGVPTRRLYFIQDFEPWFFPLGSEYLLAEDSYRFGFRSITVGRMIADILRERFGVAAAVAEFGCDTSVYRLTNTAERRDVVFYGRRDTPRRGFELGVVALRAFHERHPDHEIHVFGDASAEMPFAATNHGRITPARLSELYNQCVAGIALSFTNASLVPDEMLACGAIPVVGDSTHARACLDNPYVRWAHPSPLGLADALSEIIALGSPPATEVAASVQGKGWDRAQLVTLETIEDEVYGPGL